jgi:hypothetical protein
MSDFLYNYGAKSQTDDLAIAIIKALGEKIESQTGTNPDAQFNYQFAAGDYNHGNRSQTDDLLEEILNRINTWNGGGGGGGSADGNDRLKISSNDTTAGFLLDKLALASSEVLFSEAGDGGNETLKLLAQFATRTGEKAYVGTVSGGAKFNVKADTGQDPFRACIGNGTVAMAVKENGQLVVGQGTLSAGTDHSNTLLEAVDPLSGQRLRIGNNLRQFSGRTTGIGIQMSRESSDSYAVGNGIFTTLDDMAYVARNFHIFSSGRNATINEWSARWDVSNLLATGSGGAHFAFGGNLGTDAEKHFHVSNENENTSTAGINAIIGSFEQHRVVTAFSTNDYELNAAAAFESKAVQSNTRAKNIGSIHRAGGAQWNYAIMVPVGQGTVQLGVSGNDLDNAMVAPTGTLHIGNSATPAEQLRLQHTFTPSGDDDAAGQVGNIAYDGSYMYIKTSNGWGRAALDFNF